MSSPQNTLAASFTQRLSALRDQTLKVVDALRDLQQVQVQFLCEGFGMQSEKPKAAALQTPRS